MNSPQSPLEHGAAPRDARVTLNEFELSRLRQRRHGRRCPFSVEQKVIPIVNGRPDKDQARQVNFHDISISGVAFYWRRPPEFEEAVIVLDILPESIYLRVRVERCNVICQLPRTFVVGCSFVERIGAI